MRAELAGAPSIGARLDLFERLLAERLPVVRGLHPAVAQALQQFRTATSVGDVVRSSGYSHRRFIALFAGRSG